MRKSNPFAAGIALAIISLTACAQQSPPVQVSAAPSAASVSAPSPASAGPVAAAQGTLIAISSTGEVKRIPDIAQLSTGVVTQAVDANSAMQANAAQMQKVYAALREAGISERDVQTSGISLYPQQQYVENQPPRITGYQASNTVTITVRDLKRLGPTLDALVAMGANQVNGPTFDVGEKGPALDEARTKALQQARAQAQVYAKALGVSVRRIVSISEGARVGIPHPMPMVAMASRAEKADTPIAAGENTLSVTLEVVFELGN